MNPVIVAALLGGIVLTSCTQQDEIRHVGASQLAKILSEAAAGDMTSQHKLGQMYTYGEGVPENDAEAAKWYRLAAEQGNAEAQYELGFMYKRGWGVPQNRIEAVKWYSLSAKQGNARAQYLLGGEYVFGLSVPKNYVKGYAWLSIAAAAGKNADTLNMIKSRMTKDEIAAGQALAAHWIESNYKNCD